ncbi:MAG: stage II sporulation protein M, partial [Synergistaceae bacterium]|nr:stage II sporulation protein M [Synergistaceae bacterium]
MTANMADATDRTDSSFSGPGPSVRGALTLRSAEFRKGREDGWRRLDDIVNLVESRGISALSVEEARQLPLLYRAAMSSLSVARTIVLDRNLLLYLENLTLRAYLVVYGPRVGILQSLFDFFGGEFPRGVRKMRRHLLVVFSVMVVGAVAGCVLVRSDAGSFDLLVPKELAGGRGPGSSATELIKDELFAPWPGFVNAFVVFANSLFRHNAVVGIFSFGLGFALGVPTLFLIAHNGLILGAFLAIHAERGLTPDFIGWMSIHGVTEILAVLLCGAAGLVVAEKILFPGPLPRLESLAL